MSQAIQIGGWILVAALLSGCTCSNKGSGSSPEVQTESLKPAVQVATSTESAEQAVPTKECYRKEFKPEQFPWKIQDCMNYEEVFKDYEYVLAKWDAPTTTVTLTHFVQGNVRETKQFKYLKSPSGAWKFITP